MTIQDTVGVYNQAEFADNPEARCSIVLIIDVSGSMAGDSIDTVNQALVKFRDVIRDDPVAALRADIAIIVFDDEAWVGMDFTNGANFNPPLLSTHGGTNYSKAVNLALDLIETRKQSYRDGGVAYYRSLAYFLTDGFPQDDNTDDLSQAARRLAAAEENRSVAFFPFIIKGDIEGLVDTGDIAAMVGVTTEELLRVAGTGDIVGGADRIIGIDYAKVAAMAGVSEQELAERINREVTAQTPMEELTRLAPRPPRELTNLAQLEGSIQWLSRSASAVSQSQVGDSIRLPPQDFLDF